MQVDPYHFEPPKFKVVAVKNSARDPPESGSHKSLGVGDTHHLNSGAVRVNDYLAQRKAPDGKDLPPENAVLGTVICQKKMYIIFNIKRWREKFDLFWTGNTKKTAHFGKRAFFDTKIWMMPPSNSSPRHQIFTAP